jgi:hypothetical protein
LVATIFDISSQPVVGGAISNPADGADATSPSLDDETPNKEP